MVDLVLNFIVECCIIICLRPGLVFVLVIDLLYLPNFIVFSVRLIKFILLLMYSPGPGVYLASILRFNL
jgi:hypothetical protein